VIGFGSYHSFPVLCAALLKKVPIILFESNAEPGKVNRFFSRWAKVTAVQFPEAARSLQGNSVEVSMPLKKQENRATLSEARDYFSLQADKLTFLVFGGSQGADTINRGVYEAFVALKKTGSDFQVIHLTGSAKNSEALRSMYQNGSISAQVKEFEHHMDLAWIAADLAICRCGAGTIAEQIDFEVPGILIPYPYAYEHQSKNGLFMTQKVGGAVMLKDDELKGSTLQKMIEGLIDPQKNALAAMRHSIAEFKRHRNVQTLSDLVIKEMEI
jgi:UDP-N-acetylglucosamine--N-acetylmuramyl-(pentapeptide) pyrophosphoryl-undecaprenol N-acetylglucosamine transferase